LLLLLLLLLSLVLLQLARGPFVRKGGGVSWSAWEQSDFSLLRGQGGGEGVGVRARGLESCAYKSWWYFAGMKAGTILLYTQMPFHCFSHPFSEQKSKNIKMLAISVFFWFVLPKELLFFSMFSLPGAFFSPSSKTAHTTCSDQLPEPPYKLPT
jgi:hypothetical protein